MDSDNITNLNLPCSLNPALSQVARRLDFDSDICDCVRDVDSNGLYKYLQLTAFQIRYPGITSGNSTVTDSCKFKLNNH